MYATFEKYKSKNGDNNKNNNKIKCK